MSGEQGEGERACAGRTAELLDAGFDHAAQDARLLVEHGVVRLQRVLQLLPAALDRAHFDGRRAHLRSEGT